MDAGGCRNDVANFNDDHSSKAQPESTDPKYIATSFGDSLVQWKCAQPQCKQHTKWR